MILLLLLLFCIFFVCFVFTVLLAELLSVVLAELFVTCPDCCLLPYICHHVLVMHEREGEA